MQELLSVLDSVRDPVVFVVCVASTWYLNKNYVSKEVFEEFKKNHSEHRTEIGTNITTLKKHYVSKEKLDDVLKSVEDQLKTIGREISEIKKIMFDVIRR